MNKNEIIQIQGIEYKEMTMSQRKLYFCIAAVPRAAVM